MIPQIYDSPLCKDLRRKIQAHRIKRLGWSDYVFHFIMNGLGYGESLRDLDETRLAELYTIVKNYKRNKRPQEYRYDQQGKFMYVLQKQAGWSDTTLRQYLTITYKKTHWNLLDSDERRAVIALFQSLIEEKK